MRQWRYWCKVASCFLLLLFVCGAAYATSGTVEGLSEISQIMCENNTTDQRVRLYPNGNTYNCEDAGLQVSADDFIRQSIRGVAADNSGIRGTVSGITNLTLLYCRNRTTGQRVRQWYPKDLNWNCSDLGLRTSAGQVVEAKLYGYAQGPIPPAPTGLIAKSGVGETLLSWDAIPDAVQYNVYMSTAAGATPSKDTLQATVAINEHAVTGLANNTTYYFIVTAVNAYGEGNPSAEVSVIPGFFDHSTVVGQPCTGCHDGKSATDKPVTHPLTTNLCEACHFTIQWIPLVVPFDHSQTSDTCAYCHNGSTATGKSATHPATTNLCEVCHFQNLWTLFISPINHNQTTDVCERCHNGVVAVGKGASHIPTSAPCDTCHTTMAFIPVVAFDHSGVAGINCAVAGCHDGASGQSYKPSIHPLTTNLCEACHQTNSWIPLIIPIDHSQTTEVCVSCHNGGIAPTKPGSHPPTTNVCEACHTTATWPPVSIIDHSQVTASSCSAAGCHSDTQKTSAHCPTTDDCSVCHTPTSWATAFQDCTTPIPPPPPLPPGGGMGGSIPNQPPSVTITGPTSGCINQTLTFSSLAQDPENDLLSYQWQVLPAGTAVISTPRQASTNITFVTAGNHTVVLEVTDSAQNTASTSVSVVIQSLMLCTIN